MSSGTPGREVRFHGVLLFAAFEPIGSQGPLRLELSSDTPEPAVVTAPRVMMGRHIGGVATEFVQGY